VSPYLDWDLWLGPAPERTYHERYHPYGPCRRRNGIERRPPPHPMW
jgi:hypothetical protein